MSSAKFLWIMIFMGSLLGCAGSPSHKKQIASRHHVSQSSPRIEDREVNELYRQLNDEGQRYRNALDLRHAGEIEHASKESKLSLDNLQKLANQCVMTSGCDVQRFFSMLDYLLRLEGNMLADANGNALHGNEADEDLTTTEASSPMINLLPEMSRTATLLNGKQLSELIALNTPVKVGIEEWLTQLRPALMSTYENYQYMRYRMWPEYEKAGLPEAILFGILAKESGGKVHSVSRAGASGPLQFMYATGSRFGLNTLNGFDQRFDPTLSTRANAAYLNEQLKIFNNNLELVLGAYNGGEGFMQRLVTRTSANSFWDPAVYSAVPDETRDYVPRVLAAAWLFLHPERYNLEFPKFDTKPGTLTLKTPASLTELTICLGNKGNRNGWFRTLRNLNPALNPQHRQPIGTQLEAPAYLVNLYNKSCISGAWTTLASELHSAVAESSLARTTATPKTVSSKKEKTASYTVKKGETLVGIARKFQCADTKQLAAANQIKPPAYALKTGQILQVPDCKNS